MMNMQADVEQTTDEQDPDRLYSVSVMGSMMDSMIQGSKTNNLADFKAWLDSGESGMEELTTDITYTYSTPLTIYRTDNGLQKVNPSTLFSDLGVIPADTSGTLLGQSMQMDVWTQLTGNEDLLKAQYDVIAGRLPEQYNDFIFSVICEELGLIGACVIMLIFSMLILRGFWIALHARDRFGALLVVGVMTHLALQTFLNIAVVSGFVPTTGISLPFFSYGGTALCLQLVEMGIVLSVSRQIPAARAG